MVCPRCGQPVERERRRVVHRLLSIVYPVRYYVCSQDCGWTGLRSGGSHWDWKLNKRRLLRVVLVLLLALCAVEFVQYLTLHGSNPPGE
jgi:hypothetical protein